MYIMHHSMISIKIDRMSRKCKAVFSTEETKQLIQLFDDGLDSVSKEKAQAIKDTAVKFN